MNATITVTPGSIDDHVDEFCSRLDAAGFPVLHADLAEGEVLVNASLDPNEYSILMAAGIAALAVGIEEENISSVALS